jgi:hypothetical protein
VRPKGLDASDGVVRPAELQLADRRPSCQPANEITGRAFNRGNGRVGIAAHPFASTRRHDAKRSLGVLGVGLVPRQPRHNVLEPYSLVVRDPVRSSYVLVVRPELEQSNGEKPLAKQ